MGMGGKHQTWSKELTDKLLTEIAAGRNYTGLEVSMKMSTMTIRRKLKEMGFDGLKDARKIMTS